jgi:hypothetical protein
MNINENQKNPFSPFYDWIGSLFHTKPKPETKIKTCKDCYYFIHNSLNSELSSCSHPKTQIKPSPITGKVLTSYCRVLRGYYGDCGPSGIYWTPKETEQIRL